MLLTTILKRRDVLFINHLAWFHFKANYSLFTYNCDVCIPITVQCQWCLTAPYTSLINRYHWTNLYKLLMMSVFRVPDRVIITATWSLLAIDEPWPISSPAKQSSLKLIPTMTEGRVDCLEGERERDSENLWTLLASTKTNSTTLLAVLAVATLHRTSLRHSNPPVVDWMDPLVTVSAVVLEELLATARKVVTNRPMALLLEDSGTPMHQACRPHPPVNSLKLVELALNRARCN